jgi:hypothetical protein
MLTRLLALEQLGYTQAVRLADWKDFERMVGARGFEPPTPWSRKRNRFTTSLIRMGGYCVVQVRFAGYLGAFGPKLDSMKMGSPIILAAFAALVAIGRPMVLPLLAN